MLIEVTVTVQVERVSGKFAPKDEIYDQIIEVLEGCNPDTISGIGADGTSEYEITDWGVG